MIYTFHKQSDGRRMGIDLANITFVEDEGNVRIIGTVTENFAVVEPYEEIVSVVNHYKSAYLTKYYVNN